MKACFKLNKKRVSSPPVLIPNSRPSFIQITGDDLTYSTSAGPGNITAVYSNTQLSGYKTTPPLQPQIFYSTGLNRNLLDTEYSFNGTGTFYIKLNIQFTSADIFIIYLNW